MKCVAKFTAEYPDTDWPKRTVEIWKVDTGHQIFFFKGDDVSADVMQIDSDNMSDIYAEALAHLNPEMDG